MCTVAASWRVCSSATGVPTVASNTGMTWLPESVNMLPGAGIGEGADERVGASVGHR